MFELRRIINNISYGLARMFVMLLSSFLSIVIRFVLNHANI